MKELRWNDNALLSSMLNNVITQDRRTKKKQNAWSSDRRIGRCPKEMGYALKTNLSRLGVRVRLYPCGKGKKGGLEKTSECIAYMDNCNCSTAVALAAVKFEQPTSDLEKIAHPLRPNNLRVWAETKWRVQCILEWNQKHQHEEHLTYSDHVIRRPDLKTHKSPTPSDARRLGQIRRKLVDWKTGKMERRLLCRQALSILHSAWIREQQEKGKIESARFVFLPTAAKFSKHALGRSYVTIMLPEPKTRDDGGIAHEKTSNQA